MTSEEIKLITETVTQSVSQQISQIIDEKLKPINERLDIIEENTEITRAVTNEIVEWIDYNFRDQYPFPVAKKKVI